MRSAFRRLSALLAGTCAERDLEDEVRFHLDTLAEEYQRKGMPQVEARAAARRDFGGVARMKEAYREQRGVPLIETTLQDLRYGLRGLWRSPGFTLAAMISLALGIGANTAIFSLFNTLMLRMLPVREPEQIVSLYRVGGWGRGFTSYPLYQELLKQTDLFEGVLARSAPWRVRYTTAGSTEQPDFLFREFVSANYFEVLGVQPALGRLFAGEESSPQAQPYAVLNYDFWQARFYGDPNVPGKQIVIDDQPLTIIGVARKGFRGVQVEGQADVWVPITMHRARFQDAGMHWLWLLARLQPGVQGEEAQAKVNVLVRNFLNSNYANDPNTPWQRKRMGQRLELRAGGTGVSFLRDQFQKPLLLLMALVTLILLIACSNVANLLLARGTARRREIALRLSLGASRLRLVRQWLTETSLLAAVGIPAGIALGIWGSRNIVQFLPVDDANLTLDVKPDANVILFTVTVSLAAMFLFGLLPALVSTNVPPGAVLKEGSAGSGRGCRHRVRKTLVVTQVALCIVLVSGATLFSRSLFALNTTDTGFHHYDVLTFQFDSPRSYKSSQVASIRERLVQRIRAIPGVTAVSYGFPGPYQGGTWSAGIRVPGSERTAVEPASVELQSVAARYFETIGSLPVRGRDFQDSGAEQMRKVAIVNEAFSREYLNGADPVGHTLSFDDKEPQGGIPIYIVGQVRNMLHQGVREHPVPTVYLPVTQMESTSDPILLVRAGVSTGTLVPLLRRELAALDRAVTLSGVRTVRQRFEDSIFLDRLIASVSVLFAILSLVLAGVGLYGVMSYLVAQRTAEIGIRVALGAAPGRMLWLVLRDGLILIFAGAAIGIPLALIGARLAAGLLFGVKPADPAAFAASAVFMLLIGLAAAAVPGLRAASVDPMQTLRRE
ncbi:MAG TPA: ABC transporter permease [Bryobacteraceae bacterium]|nr:ABC transporter permease [Bryobacteraceae bacterium]